MAIAIIGAIDSEIEAFKKLLSDLSSEVINGLIFYKGKLNNKDVVVTKSGCGKVRMALACATLFEHFDISYLINTGISGSVDTTIGTTTIATSCNYHDYILPSFENPVDEVYCPKKLVDHARKIFDDCLFGRILTGDQFVDSIEALHGANLFDVVSVDMESMAVAVTSKFYNKDFLIIRTVSDNLNIDKANEFEISSALKSIDKVIKFIGTYEE